MRHLLLMMRWKSIAVVALTVVMVAVALSLAQAQSQVVSKEQSLQSISSSIFQMAQAKFGGVTFSDEPSRMNSASNLNANRPDDTSSAVNTRPSSNMKYILFGSALLALLM